MEYQKYDNYDAYNLDRTEYVEDFINTHIDYLINGGRFGTPISTFDRYGNSNVIQLVDCIRPKINDKYLYKRLIWGMKPEMIEQTKDLMASGCIIIDSISYKGEEKNQ